MHLDTRLVASGSSEQSRPLGDVVPPIHLSTTFDQTQASIEGYYYGRGENPTREALEEVLASLEDANTALAFSSGQAAAAAVCALLNPGDRVVASADHYSGTHSLFEILARYQIQVDWIDLTDDTVVEAVLTSATPPAMVWLETPTNPFLHLADISRLAELTHRAGGLLVVDNTLAGPALQLPLAHGADVSLYSTTKIISGHLDTIGGAVIVNDPELGARMRAHRTAVGSIPGPFDCFLIHRGLKTLRVRVDRACSTAEELARQLTHAPGVTDVFYPGLARGKQHTIVQRQMSRPGYVISFAISGDPQQILQSTTLVKPAVSLGGVQSLIEIPATMTHAGLPDSYKRHIGLDSTVLRLSIGLEHPDDIRQDLWAALEASCS